MTDETCKEEKLPRRNSEAGEDKLGKTMIIKRKEHKNSDHKKKNRTVITTVKTNNMRTPTQTALITR